MAWLAAAQALAMLGVRPQTLYANVSRGRIRAKPDPKDTRRSLYHSADVERLARRRHGRPKVAAVAAETIGWGEPILASAVSTIADGRLWYRGRDAVALAETATLEETATLLWEAEPGLFDRPAAPRTAAPSAKIGGSPMGAAFLALAARAATDLPAQGRAASVLHGEAADLLTLLVDAMLGAAGRTRGRAIHQRIAAAWRRPRAEDVIRRALVLLADHELNASTFATRVTASTGASLAASLLAGLATLTGPLHGGAPAGVQALAASAKRVGADEAVRGWLAQGRPIPAFAHPLYPDGDVRAAALLERFSPPPLFMELRAATERIVGEPPNIDFALAALAATYDLPADAPLTLFAAARCVGWVAHALEQFATGSLIRPRARYVGPPIEARPPSDIHRLARGRHSLL
jgi:citrate synthase